MTSQSISTTPGWIARHTPTGAGAGGRDAAVIDIAQDLLLHLLLRDLHARGALDALVFKGGTALRKLYAGNQGRFSVDLDFSLAEASGEPETVVLDLVGQIEGTRFSFLADLDDDELKLAAASEKDRRVALRLLEHLPDGRLADIGIY
jgi:hypothetical protein